MDMSHGSLDFNTIHDYYRPKILRYLTRLVGGPEAEDLAQEVFIKISRGLPDFRKRSGLSTWIYRIATNTALDKLRSLDFKYMMTGKESIENDEVEIDDENPWKDEKTPPVDRQLIRKEMNGCIRRVIDGLPEDYRTVIVLSDLEEMKNNQIAEILGISLDAVKIRLHRARAKLKEALDAQCDFYRDERNELACDPKQTILHFR